jgi:hypothetical protein
MTLSTWQAAAQQFLGLDKERCIYWLVKLLYELSTMARDTYTVGGDGLDDPNRMRRFNELIRRVVRQLEEKLESRAGMPDEVFLKMVSEEVGALGFSAADLGGRLSSQRCPKSV